MLGLIAGIIGIIIFVNGVSDINRENETDKKMAILRKDYTYSTRRIGGGYVLRDTSTDREVEYEEIYGDRCLVDAKTGQVVRNISAENRTPIDHDYEIEQAKRFGKTVYCVDSSDHTHDLTYNKLYGNLRSVYGRRYRDIDTGRTFVIRKVGRCPYYIYYYMDVNTGDIVRKTDGQLQMEKKYKERTGEDWKPREIPHGITFNIDEINSQKRQYACDRIKGPNFGKFWIQESAENYSMLDWNLT